MKEVKLLVCDWDGTLVDSVGKIIAVKQFLARQHGLIPPSAKVIKNVLGKSFEIAMQDCFPQADQYLLTRLHKEFKALMQTDAYQSILFPDALEVLSNLKNNDILLAVATAKSRKELDKALDYLNLSHFFDLTCCAEEYENKPSPVMLNHIMSKFDIGNANTLMIGDTCSDIVFANNANIDIICVTFGAQSKTQLLTLKPLAFIEHWKDLPKLLENSSD